MPATAYDAKGLLIAAVRDGNPVIYIDDRWLYSELSEVPEEMYEVPIGDASVRRKGNDLTIVATSYMAAETLKAADTLSAAGIYAEVIDLRSIKPWDKSCVFRSVRKTGRLFVVDSAWKSGGVAGEIAASVAEECFEFLKGPILRVCLPDLPAPTSLSLEKAYYIHAEDIVRTVRDAIHRKESSWDTKFPSLTHENITAD